MTETADTPPRKDASTNPWYILMTVAGEQEGVGLFTNDSALHARNQRYWNGWAAAGLDTDARAKCAESLDVAPETLDPLTEDELADIRNALQQRCGDSTIPDPRDQVNFSNTIFPHRLFARGLYFREYVSFTNAEFSESATFYKSVFCKDVSFNGAKFASERYRRSAIFTDVFIFGNAQFEDTKFFGFAHFNNAEISGNTHFISTKFCQDSYFQKTIFSGNGVFKSAKFSKGADFLAAEFKGPVSFADATFETRAPRFMDAKLPEAVTWRRIRLPPVPDDLDKATDDMEAYERLKLLMGDQNKHYDEHKFLRMELQCREVVNKRRPLQVLASCLFRRVSDYGWSLGRPLLIMLVLWALGAVAIYLIEQYAEAGSCLSAWQAAALSFSNLFAFLGFGLHIMRDEIMGLTWRSELVAGIQIFCGPILLFLLGLALRNRFRLG